LKISALEKMMISSSLLLRYGVKLEITFPIPLIIPGKNKLHESLWIIWSVRQKTRLSLTFPLNSGGNKVLIHLI